MMMIKLNNYKILLPLIALLLTTNVIADDWAPEIAIGQTVPEINAMDQNGKHWNNQSLSGKKGYLLLFNRSIVW
jgi:hypothetical protein